MDIHMDNPVDIPVQVVAGILVAVVGIPAAVVDILVVVADMLAFVVRMLVFVVDIPVPAADMEGSKGSPGIQDRLEAVSGLVVDLDIVAYIHKLVLAAVALAVGLVAVSFSCTSAAVPVADFAVGRCMLVSMADDIADLLVY